MENSTVSLEQLGAWSGFSTRYLRKLAEDKVLPEITSSQLPIAAIQRLFSYVRAQKRADNLEAEKLRKMRADAQLSEVALAEKLELLADKFELLRDLTPRLLSVRQLIENSALDEKDKSEAITKIKQALEDCSPPQLKEAAAKFFEDFPTNYREALNADNQQKDQDQ